MSALLSHIGLLSGETISGGGGDPYWDNVVFLSHFDGGDGETIAIDEKGHAITFHGGAEIDTAEAPFGVSSLRLNGTNARLSIPDSVDWDFGTGDFTVELFIRFADNPVYYQALLCNFYTGGDGWIIQSDGSLLHWTSDASGSPIDRAWDPDPLVWYHVAISRNGSSLRHFVDGVQLGTTATDTTDIFGSPNPLSIGAVDVGGFDQYAKCWMKEIRITKGIGRYTTNFDVPTEEFPNF